MASTLYRTLSRVIIFYIKMYHYSIMNNNIILELSNNSAQNVINNGDFETAFQPILINEGDVIQVKNCFIDSIQQSYDQIYLPEDVNFSLTFCFYDMDNPIFPNYPDLKINRTSAGPNFEMYLMIKPPLGSDPYIYTQTATGTLTKGIYTTDSITVEINRQLVRLWGNQFIVPINTPDNINTPYNFYRFNVDINDPSNCSINMGDTYSYAQGLVNIAPYVWIGARQVAMTFNDDGDNKFKFKYLHTSCYDDDGNEIVYFGYFDINNPVSRECGVIFTDMQPRDFWGSLGFEVDKVTIQFSSLVFHNGVIVPEVLYYDDNRCSTKNFLTIDDAFGVPWGTAGAGLDARWLIFDVPKINTATWPISASQFSSFKKLCPFLMIEFLTNFNGTYLTGNDSSKFITAIVSRNYTSNNYITGYGDSAIVYQHRGSPFLLSNIRIRILNPDTKDVADDVGDNNYIILNVIKNPQ